jgi:histone-lysine N-methyltransferase SUV39H
MIHLQIFRNEFTGWGVRTLELIPKGTFVTTYAGEVIPVSVAEQRGKVYDSLNRTYLFDLDYFYDDKNGPTVVSSQGSRRGKQIS